MDQQTVKELLDYDQETGLFVWKRRFVGRHGSLRTVNAFNTRKAGRQAGHINGETGYIDLKLNTILYKSHRIAFLWMTGAMPLVVDHINRQRDDNRWCNLRSADYFLNGQNRSRSRNNASGYANISLHKASGKWRVSFVRFKKEIYLGLFDQIADAVQARDAALEGPFT